MRAMTTPSLNPLRNKHRRHQRGAAMLILMLIVMLGLITLFTFRMDRKAPELDADRKTALALAQAKEALLGYAAADANRPGSLPCPDINDDGDTTVGIDASCTATVVARLPWKQLRLTDLRDGNAERLWYAVSPNFRASLSTALNSTFGGQITIRDSNGVIVYNANASPSTGVIAVIIAPGSVITRQGAAMPQDRSCTGGGGCSANATCLAPYQSVAKCNPTNYLDILNGIEDNADFSAPAPPSPPNGFITGVIKDASGATLVNDRILTITKQELFSVVTVRMAHELANYWNNPPGNYFPPSSTSSFTSVPVPTIWSNNGWNSAVTVSNSTLTQFTIQFANCSAGYTITIDNTYGVTRNGQC